MADAGSAPAEWIPEQYNHYHLNLSINQQAKVSGACKQERYCDLAGQPVFQKLNA